MRKSAKISKIFENKILRNILILFKGNVFASIIALINTAILVKAIGLEQNGMIFMALSYIMLFNAIFNFQSYNAIIRYIPRVKDNKEKMSSYITQGFILDIVTAGLAMVMAVVCIPIFMKIMKWDTSMSLYLKLYVIIILFKTTGTMLGILRIFEKFKESVNVNIIESISKLVLYIICMSLNLKIEAYILAEIISLLVSVLYMMYISRKVLIENDIKLRKVKIDKEFLKYNIYSNIEMAVDLPIQYITPFVINGFLGFSDISVYKIIEKIGGIISRVTLPISQAIYPNLSEAIGENRINDAISMHKKIIKNIGIFGTLIIVITFITHKIWLWILIPINKVNVAALILYLISIILNNMFMALYPIFNFLGYIKQNIKIVLISNIIYLIILIYLANMIGLIGVIIAKIIQSIIVIIAKEVILKRNSYMEIAI